MTQFIVRFWIVACVFMAILALMGLHAKAHKHGSQSYSPYCCSGKDCAPARVSVNPDGSITATNQFGTAKFSPQTFRPSQDGQWHACIHPALGSRCLYVPAGS